MAQLPLNTFKTKTAMLSTTSNSIVYTAPVGITTIILMANAANIDNTSTHLVSFAHYRNLTVYADANGYGYQPGNTVTEQVANFPVPPDNAASLLSGKLIVESQDSIMAWADTTGTMKLTLSILETANS